MRQEGTGRSLPSALLDCELPEMKQEMKMLSANALERASPGYRRGYVDAARGREVQYTAEEGLPGTFAHTDYMDGYEAAKNDMKWSRR